MRDAVLAARPGPLICLDQTRFRRPCGGGSRPAHLCPGPPGRDRCCRAGRLARAIRPGMGLALPNGSRPGRLGRLARVPSGRRGLRLAGTASVLRTRHVAEVLRCAEHDRIHLRPPAPPPGAVRWPGLGPGGMVSAIGSMTSTNCTHKTAGIAPEGARADPAPAVVGLTDYCHHFLGGRRRTLDQRELGRADVRPGEHGLLRRQQPTSTPGRPGRSGTLVIFAGERTRVSASTALHGAEPARAALRTPRVT